MKTASLLLNCCSNSLSHSTTTTHKLPLATASFHNPSSSSPNNSLCFILSPFNKIHPQSLSSLHSLATEAIVETIESESEFVEVGYITGVHGLHGEVRVAAKTDFPELRFSEAQQLVGSTILITEEDKPELEEGEFYTNGLVGMRVILKESGELVGTVVSVFNSGASDLLHVMLDSSFVKPDDTGNLNSEASTSAPAPLVWVPFVEAIVPNVDMHKREMLITPPKGLFEVNLRSDERSKKERRQLEWKEKKKLQKRLIAAKKKLSQMEQRHVFDGFRHGERAQGSLLAEQIVGVNSKLLQVAVQKIETPSNKWNSSEFITANYPNQMRSTYKISEDCLFTGGGENAENLQGSLKLFKKSNFLKSKGKVETILVVDGAKNEDDRERTEDIRLQNLVSDVERLVKVIH